MRQKRVQLKGDIASLRATMALAKERQEREIEHRAKIDGGEDGDEDEISVSHRVYVIQACKPLNPQVDAGDNKKSCSFSVKTNL